MCTNRKGIGDEKEKMEIPYEALSLWEALCLCRHHENAHFDADKRMIVLPDI